MTDRLAVVPFLDLCAATPELEAPVLEAIERVVRGSWYVGSRQKYMHDILVANSRLDEIRSTVLRIRWQHVDS
jgi:hypothetical protein